MPLYVFSQSVLYISKLTVNLCSHLLPKKSYHVYNESNISRVRADEAAAAAAEHAQEQRAQAVDAARRLAILRGETPPPLPEFEPEIDPAHTKFARRDETSSTGFGPRKRKRKGEDDTDFEVRMARERAEAGGRIAEELARGGEGDNRKRAVVDIVGKDGHIDLIGAPTPEIGKTDKNAEYEKEAARKKRELEDQYTMRFSNAAGRDGFAAGDPWYASSSNRQRAPASTTASKDGEVGMEAPTKNVWGRDDPKRQDREIKRITSHDPLAMMKMGAKKVREIEKERRRENEERARDMKELEREERRREKRMRRERRHEDDGRHRHRSKRSDRSEHSIRRDRDYDQGNSRHRHRDDPGRNHEREGESRMNGQRPRDQDRRRSRDGSGISESQRDREEHRRSAQRINETR